ncbi:MAG: 2-oxo-4-hydroxy-4-carboxy-5-ureidoimidazoline decarboxylase [Sciscionella sp.]
MPIGIPSDVTPSGTAVQRFNVAAEAELTAQLEHCLAAPRWIAALRDGRPYPDLDAILRRSRALVQRLDRAEVLAAVAAHPRIGAATAVNSSAAAEQAGVDRGNAQLLAELRTANARYETTFGHRYLVCATGRDGAAILLDLRDRCANTAAEEIIVMRHELAAITELRLHRLLGV